MRLDDVHLVTKQLRRSTNAEVSEAEALEMRFPPGFREWMTTLGAGFLCEEIRVYPIRDLLLLIVDARARWHEYDFWDEGYDVLPREAVLESIVVADTMNGDEVVFHPSNPAGMYLLPRGEARIYPIGARFEDALEWLCTSGVVCEPVSSFYFEPWPPRPEDRMPPRVIVMEATSPTGEEWISSQATTSKVHMAGTEGFSKLKLWVFVAPDDVRGAHVDEYREGVRVHYPESELAQWVALQVAQHRQ